MTLPTILFAEANPQDNLIQRVIANRDTKSVTLAVENIRSSPVIGECLALGSDFCSRASRALDVLPDNSYRQALLDLAAYIIQRRK